MKIKSKYGFIIFLCCVCFVVTNLVLLTSMLSEPIPVQAAQSEEETVASSGVCGTDATWEYSEDTNTLTISGSGAMTSYAYGTAPWYSYASKINKVVVFDEITSISAGAFYGCNALQEITLPFVGANETAAGYFGNFGYIFGYQKYTSWGERILSNGASLHFMARYGEGETDNFYEAPKNTSSYDIYYYYVPSSITRVNITSAKKIAAGAFYDYNHITEISLNNEITVINDYAFKNCGVVSYFFGFFLKNFCFFAEKPRDVCYNSADKT